jgi:hypothetical protein
MSTPQFIEVGTMFHLCGYPTNRELASKSFYLNVVFLVNKSRRGPSLLDDTIFQ